MIKTTITGEQAWHVFIDTNGNEVKEECTIKKYNDLAKNNPQNPQKNGLTWKYSYKDWKYNTPSGRLEDGYYVEHLGKIIAKSVGKKQTTVDNLNEL